ncbi:myelin-oligodendrocyte glycoprotein-like [Myripristis murdjan]|uniref:myelin-oligodendrocyte glycoprotein-like n=1 Tax=Myripristis murdjan TaxID=586833 RepID=UPI0011762487|nr:myelin-oligodendrocyte glycoprotein-like [Myripristis murdjan]
MLHPKDGRSLRLRLSVLSVSALHLTVVFLLLTHSCAAQSQLIGPPQPIVVVVGDDVILPSHLDPPMDVAAKTVEWARSDTAERRFVHVWRGGRDFVLNQHPSYEGRTSLFTDKLRNGDVSLKLSEVKLSDEGKYRCFIPSLHRESFVELVIGAASSPVIHTSKSSSGVRRRCTMRRKEKKKRRPDF